MAGVRLHIPSGEISLSAGVAKTVVSATAAANHRFLVRGIKVFFKGTSATDTPVTIRLFRPTNAGTATAVTALKNHDGDDETPQTAGFKDYSAEPTVGDVLEIWEIHPQTGLIEFLPLGEEVHVKGGGRIGLEMKAAQAQTVSAGLYIDE